MHRRTKRGSPAHTSGMQTSKTARRGYTLSAILFLAALTVGILRWAAGNISTDGSFLLLMALAAAAVTVYARVAGIATAQRNRSGATTNEHLATVTSITAAGRHDAA